MYSVCNWETAVVNIMNEYTTAAAVRFVYRNIP
jgi:hypothetical protein